MKLVSTTTIPGYSGRAIPVDAGAHVRVTDIEGAPQGAGAPMRPCAEH